MGKVDEKEKERKFVILDFFLSDLVPSEQSHGNRLTSQSQERAQGFAAATRADFPVAAKFFAKQQKVYIEWLKMLRIREYFSQSG